MRVRLVMPIAKDKNWPFAIISWQPGDALTQVLTRGDPCGGREVFSPRHCDPLCWDSIRNASV